MAGAGAADGGRGGYFYSLPTTYSAQSKQDTGDVSKEGGNVFDQPTGRYTVPTLFLKSGAKRIYLS